MSSPHAQQAQLQFDDSDAVADPGNEAAADDAYRILVIEDDELLRHGIRQALDGAGFRTFVFEFAQQALARLQDIVPDVVLTDLYLNEQDNLTGMEVIDRVLRHDAELPVVLMTARGNIPVAIEAIRKGAYDFLEKPFEKDRVTGLLKRAAAQRRLALENRSLRERLSFVSGIERIMLGQSSQMRALAGTILHLAPTPANVIVLGETGSGKEIVARCLHEFGRRTGPFVAINCAAIPETLFESELFGHEAGAYTGAARQRIGKIEHASGGTLFLDEIEAMPLQMQAKLLRVLQERQVERLGSNKQIAVDLRVVAATKVDLKEYGEQGHFRIDLFYRLNVAMLRIPPLRERREDIPLLFLRFVQEAAIRFGLRPPAPDTDVLLRLQAYDWPGNVRELRNAAEQCVLGLPMPLGQEAAPLPVTRSLEKSVAAYEKATIEDTLRRHDGVANSACKELDINYTTLYRKMKHFGLELSHYKTRGE